jgi:hypothetical protein
VRCTRCVSCDWQQRASHIALLPLTAAIVVLWCSSRKEARRLHACSLLTKGIIVGVPETGSRVNAATRFSSRGEWGGFTSGWR